MIKNHQFFEINDDKVTINLIFEDKILNIMFLLYSKEIFEHFKLQYNLYFIKCL